MRGGAGSRPPLDLKPAACRRHPACRPWTTLRSGPLRVPPGGGQRLTPQRLGVFDRVFATHDHFSAETLYGWLKEDPESRVSRATVYRTLDLLERGGFIESFNTGLGEKVYEHVMGHAHHDHMVCRSCGAIVEFHDERIEALQLENARAHGFEVHSHVLRLAGYCRACVAARSEA